MKVSMIAAMDRNRVIGSSSGGIPWNLPRDRQHFRDQTRGNWMALGRSTYEEMEGWFSDQSPVIITSQSDYRPFQIGHRVSSSLQKGIQTARENNAKELFIAGGASLYEKGLKSANRLLITRINTKSEGDLLFPEFESTGSWAITYLERWPADSENSFDMTFEIWERRG